MLRIRQEHGWLLLLHDTGVLVPLLRVRVSVCKEEIRWKKTRHMGVGFVNLYSEQTRDARVSCCVLPQIYHKSPFRGQVVAPSIGAKKKLVKPIFFGGGEDENQTFATSFLEFRRDKTQYARVVHIHMHQQWVPHDA